MKNNKILEIEFEDIGKKKFKISLDDPIDNIELSQINNISSLVIDSELFVGKVGKLEKFTKAYIKEINYEDIV
ncbi:DUF2922 family protein [Peptoniphilus stercorisuis]|uniref:DUF2922 domain-containing protein n=1 Tax=Peptoniphilus stercorisuis TaxID=1436965 RepID=A0ABS4K9R3_9FIRM|nr:DUF2922 family protein [Peptoniphilus stercorisuis]MBP2024515.1 hypothetical protein [Peptoniphilus stercorisuis]